MLHRKLSCGTGFHFVLWNRAKGNNCKMTLALVHSESCRFPPLMHHTLKQMSHRKPFVETGLNFCRMELYQGKQLQNESRFMQSEVCGFHAGTERK